MKAVMREVAQARRHYSKLPFFEFLRRETIAPRDRLAFHPCMAPFVLALPDLDRYVLRDELSTDRHQALVNALVRDDDPQWRWYLEDLAKLGFDRASGVAQVLRSSMKDDMRESRMLASRLAQAIHAAAPVEKLVIVECLRQAGDVLFELTSAIAQQVRAAGGPELRYLGQHHFARAAGHASRGVDERVLEKIELDPVARVRCLGLAFRVFDLFADWSNELLAYAENSLAQRTLPQLVHGRTA